MRERKDLRPSQVKIVKEICASRGLQVVLGMGGGKSASALTAIRDLLDAGDIRCAIVLAPVRVALTTWPDEVRKWSHLAGTDMVVLKGSPGRRTRLLMEDYEVYVCSIDNIVWLIDTLRSMPNGDRRWDMLVIDELSRFKSPRGERAKKLARFAERFGSIIGLTGTPRPNGWEDQYMPLRIVSAGEAWGGKGFDVWRQDNFRAEDPWGYNWTVRADAVPRLQKTVNEWTISIPPSEAASVGFNSGPDFDVVVPVSGDALRDLKTMEEQLFIELGVDAVDPHDDGLVVALSKAVASGKMAQVLQGFLYQQRDVVKEYGQAKLDAVADMLEGIGHEPTILVYNYREDLAALKRRFGDIPHLGHGVSNAQTIATLRAWNEGKLPLVAIHPASAGHGLEMQFGGRRMIWYSMTWSSELYIQTVKRIARPGQKDPVYVHRVLADHWLERLRLDRVETKIAEEADFIGGLNG
jgi:hypothetical protein